MSAPSHPLFWFRSDLRVGDNAGFRRAYDLARRGGGSLMAVFAFCPGQWLEHDRSPVRVEFMLRSLRMLAERLDALGVPLLVVRTPRYAGVAAELVALARRHRRDLLIFQEEYEIDERRRDESVRAAFRGAGIGVESADDQVVFAPGLVRTKEDAFYTVFSPFKRRWRERWKSGEGPAPAPTPTKPLPPPPVRPDPIPARVEGFAWSDDEAARWATLWPAGEDAARKRLRAFVDRGEDGIAGYDRRRDVPSVEGTSGLSPYLAAGLIGVRSCLHAALDANEGLVDEGQPGVVGWIDELIWREFYKHILVGFPRVCMGRPFKPETDHVPWNENADHLAAWREGRTGYPIVDAAMRQLAATGWMHNRLRMVVAMFFTKNLFLDWRLGERHFMRSLIDGDLAANNGGWQWSASTGTDAQPYFRVFNPSSQSKRFDPEGAFIRRFVPELCGVGAALLHDPARLASVGRGAGYPGPIVDHATTRRHAIEAFRSAVRG